MTIYHKYEKCPTLELNMEVYSDYYFGLNIYFSLNCKAQKEDVNPLMLSVWSFLLETMNLLRGNVMKR